MPLVVRKTSVQRTPFVRVPVGCVYYEAGNLRIKYDEGRRLSDVFGALLAVANDSTREQTIGELFLSQNSI